MRGSNTAAKRYILAVLFILFISGIALTLHGCMNSHSRPHGNQDTTISVSPDGKLLIFNAAGEGARDLYTLNLQSGLVSLVAATPEYETAPSFSPDGKWIVYAAGSPGERGDHIYVRDVATGRVSRITSGQDNDCSPAFFPDSRRIVFVRDTHYNWGGLAASWGGGGALWSINRDGSGMKRLLPKNIYAFSPSVSSDGKTLVWWNEGIFTSRINGMGGPHKVAVEDLQAVGQMQWNAVFSPSGNQIAFISGRSDGDQMIHIMPVRSGKPVTLTQAGTACNHPVFSPNGRTIYYLVESWPDGLTDDPKYSLWQILTNGTGPKKLANWTLFDDPLHWRP